MNRDNGTKTRWFSVAYPTISLRNVCKVQDKYDDAVAASNKDELHFNA